MGRGSGTGIDILAQQEATRATNSAAKASGASDLHLEGGLPACLRLRGVLKSQGAGASVFTALDARDPQGPAARHPESKTSGLHPPRKVENRPPRRSF